MRWSDQFYAWRAGDSCPLCEEGRPDSTAGSARFYSGAVSDAYLVRLLADVEALRRAIDGGDYIP